MHPLKDAQVVSGINKFDFVLTNTNKSHKTIWHALLTEITDPYALAYTALQIFDYADLHLPSSPDI